MSQFPISNNPYSPVEERLNTITHGLGFVAAFIGLVFLLTKVDGWYGQVICIVYGVSMMLMFLSSTLYHGVRQPDTKAWLKVADHSAIYLLIAGTYTPFMVLGIGGSLGAVAMMFIWLIALAGILFKCFGSKRFPKISLFTYLIMGWLAIFFIYPLYKALSPDGFWLLLGGGLCYSLGVMFYVAKKRQFTHAIWHMFVVAGCACHFFAVYRHVI